MTFVLAVIVFPLLLVVLSLGVGLLAQRVAGVAIPSVLLAPLGFAGIVGVTQVTTWSGTIAPATPAILVILAITGLALSWGGVAAGWRTRRSGWWWIPAAGVGAYLVVAAPVLLSGHVTFPGYLLDTTGSIQLMGAQRLITEGHSFTVPGSGYGLTLHAFFGTGYPSGSHTAFAGVGRLVGVDLIWLYASFMASMLGLSALVLGFLARRAGLPRPAAALAGLVAAVPALVYAYALQGSIKEVSLLPTLLLLGALVVLARPLLAAGPRGVVPLGVAGAAGWATVGFAFMPWLGLSALAMLVLGIGVLPRDRRARTRAIVARASVLAAAIALLALPTVVALRTSLNLATSVSNSNAAAVADPGNLFRPLLKVQALGVWLGSSHRGDPEHLTATYVLVGVVAVGLMMGLLWLLRRRQWTLLAYVAISLLVWLALTPRATTWTAAKLLVLLSPVLVLVAMIGALGRLGPRRLDGVLLAGLITVGVLASDAYLYHSTTMAPTQRFEELRQVGERFAGRGPTLTPDFDEYSLYLLRDMAPDGPGNANKVRRWKMTDRLGTSYGHSYDLDALNPGLVEGFKAIVMRRSPFRSRPPGDFALAERGRDYEVWLRRSAAPEAREHLGLGTLEQPAVVPACHTLGTFAERARGAGWRDLRFAGREANVVASLARAQRSALAVLQGDGSIAFAGPGSVSARVRVPRVGRYRLWVEGNTGRKLSATVDGRPAGAVTNVSGGEGNVLWFDVVALSAGPHTVTIRRGGGSLAPGNAAFTNVRTMALAPVSADAESVESVPVGAWRTLCGRRLDWIEASS